MICINAETIFVILSIMLVIVLVIAVITLIQDRHMLIDMIFNR
jgi:hypothetical protein